MYEAFDIWSFLLGFPLALVITIVVLYMSWRKGRKERRFDERYKLIHTQAKSISWGVTTATILLGWMIVMIVDGPKLAFFIFMGIWVAHMLSYLIGTAVASAKN